MPSNALYYPWIDPPDRALLATSILYWDKLFTIVPASIRNPYKNRWSKAAYDLGFLRPRLVDSDCDQVQRASDEFTGDLERTAIRADVRYARQRPNRSGDGGYRFHPSKMTERLHPLKLSTDLRRQLWRSERPDQDGFYRMSSGYASAYMARLAAVIADDDGLSPYTNRRLSRDVLVDRFVDQHDDIVGRNETALASLSINTICIAPRTSLTELIRFRDDHYDELKRYRKLIRTLARQASAIGNPQFQDREVKRIVKEELKPAQEVIQAKLHEAGCDFRISATQVTSAAVVGYTASGAKSYWAALAGAVVGLSCSFVRWRLANERVRKDPLSYLANLRGRFDEGDKRP